MSAATNRPRGRALILGLLSASGFVALADAAHERDGFTRFDPRLGSEVVVAMFMLAVLGLLMVRRQFASAAIVAVGIAGSAAMTVGLKFAVARPRPPSIDRFGAVDHTYSFPSGHTLNSAVALGLIVLTLVSGMQSTARRFWATFLAVGLSIGIGASRIYLGYHWTTDVIASWLLATAWLVVLALLLSYLTRVNLFSRQSGASQVLSHTVAS